MWFGLNPITGWIAFFCLRFVAAPVGRLGTDGQTVAGPAEATGTALPTGAPAVGKEPAMGAQQDEIRRGGFGEPYCSETCYSQAGNAMATARLTGAAGKCKYCKSVVGPRHVTLVKQAGLVFICQSCRDRVQPEIQALSRCYVCEAPLWKEAESHHETRKDATVDSDNDTTLEKALRQIEETRPKGPRQNFDVIVAKVRDEFIPRVRGVKTMGATTSPADIKMLTDYLFWMICTLVKKMSGVSDGPRLQAAEEAARSAVSAWFAEHYAHYAGADIVDYFSNSAKAERLIGVLADIVIRSFTSSLTAR